MTTELPKLAAFKTTVERLDRIVKYDASAARELPNAYAREVLNLSISPRYQDRTDSGAMKMAEVVKTATLQAERARGERDRQARLQALAGELESLRDVICGMAADASIEIGFAARAMWDEACE